MDIRLRLQHPVNRPRQPRRVLLVHRNLLQQRQRLPHPRPPPLAPRVHPPRRQNRHKPKEPQAPGTPAAPAVPKGKSIKLGGARKRRREKSTLMKKKYYGRKKGKVIQIYGHKIPKRIGRHRFIIKWKTTKKNLPGKTYYGKFYNTRKGCTTEGPENAAAATPTLKKIINILNKITKILRTFPHATNRYSSWHW